MSLRLLAMVLALVSSAPVDAAKLVHLPAEEADCYEIARDWGAHCEEWKLADDPRVRLVAFGYEDGVSYAFYRRTVFGRYRDELRVEPVLASGAGHVGIYGGELHALVGDANAVQADVDYMKAADQEDESPKPDGQFRYPAVLFEGSPSGTYPVTRPLDLKPISLAELRRRARRVAD